MSTMTPKQCLTDIRKVLARKHGEDAYSKAMVYFASGDYRTALTLCDQGIRETSEFFSLDVYRNLSQLRISVLQAQISHIEISGKSDLYSARLGVIRSDCQPGDGEAWKYAPQSSMRHMHRTIRGKVRPY